MMIHPDAITGAIAYLRAEWGEEGYYVEGIHDHGRYVVLDIVHFDGSRFQVACGRHGVPCCPTCGEPHTWQRGHNRYNTGWQPMEHVHGGAA